MKIVLWIGIFLATFCFMEFMAWFTHKYVMHGFLWSLHKDHHKKDHDSWFERNDAFFIFYAVVSMILFIWVPKPNSGMAGPWALVFWPMVSLILRYTTSLSTNALRCSEMPITGMPEASVGRTKCTTSI